MVSSVSLPACPLRTCWKEARHRERTLTYSDVSQAAKHATADSPGALSHCEAVFHRRRRRLERMHVRGNFLVMGLAATHIKVYGSKLSVCAPSAWTAMVNSGFPDPLARAYCLYIRTNCVKQHRLCLGSGLLL